MRFPVASNQAKMNSTQSFSDIFCKSVQETYHLEIKRVRRITSFSGNELATVLIAVVCIALLVDSINIFLRFEILQKSSAEICNIIYFYYLCIQDNNMVLLLIII